MGEATEQLDIPRGEKPATIKSRVISALEGGARTSREVSKTVGISVSDASAHLCILRQQGIAHVTGTTRRESGKGWLYTWELVQEEGADA